MKKLQLSENGKKKAAAGLAVCFIATIAFTGIYTWQNYQNKLDEELPLEKDLEQAELEEKEENYQPTNNTVEKGEEEAKEGKETTTYVGNTVAAASPNFTENSRMLWPVNGKTVMSFSMDKAVYFATLDQYKYNPALIISCELNDNVIGAAPGVV